MVQNHEVVLKGAILRATCLRTMKEFLNSQMLGVAAYSMAANTSSSGTVAKVVA